MDEKTQFAQRTIDVCWDVANKPKDGVKISNNNHNRVIHSTHCNFWSTYTLQTFNSKEYGNCSIKFKLKINTSNENSSSGLYVGITNNNQIKDYFQSTKSINNQKNIYYSIDGFDGTVQSHATGYKEQQFNFESILRNNDVIIFELNFIEKSIKFYKNDKYLGILFDNIDLVYNNDTINYRFICSRYI